jgi:hypothetical protein
MIVSIMSERCYAEYNLCCVSLMLSVRNKVFVLSVIMLNVIMLSVVAPDQLLCPLHACYQADLRGSLFSYSRKLRH